MKIRAFFRDTRAVGTGLTAAAFTVMSLAGIGLVFDHNHLVYQRDLLKVASDSAGVALTERIRGLDCSDESAVTSTLTPVARRYILANLPERPRAKVAEEGNLTVNVTPNCAAGTVDVQASADLGGVVFGRWLGSNVNPRIEAKSGFEQVERLVEVVLAIDITPSMDLVFEGTQKNQMIKGHQQSMMEIVKRAALDLVNTLNAGGDGSAAIGLVPWSYRVRLDSAARTSWETNGWATYPTERTYPKPYSLSRASETHTLPATKPEAWQGCVDPRSTPDLSTTPPAQAPFTMGFYSSIMPGQNDPVSYQCYDDKEQKTCYSGDGNSKLRSPQFDCSSPPIIPLTTDTDEIRTAIDDLESVEYPSDYWSATYSALGVAWGRLLLTPTWRSVWGDSTHPVDPAQTDIQKVLVLLTDGEDTHLDANTGRRHRQQACTAAKNAGIKIFTIAAMSSTSTNLENSLTQCSSAADDPDGTYVFVNNATPEALKDAFSSIGRQLIKFRRTY